MEEKRLTLPGSGSSPDVEQGSIFFIGTATVLLRYAGFTILTDPNFIHMHEQVDLGGGLKATRQTNPAMEIDALPPLDLIVLSHFHGDHFDQVAEERLPKDIPIITNPSAVKALEQRGFTHLTGLNTWESITVEKGSARLRITATPGRHGPPVVSFALPDVMGSVLDFQDPQGRGWVTMYITGDTLVLDELREIPKRYPALDLALLHLGGTRVMGILVTMDADQGVELLQMIRPKVAIPIHYNDYDVFKSPLEDFQQAVHAAGLDDRVHYLHHGDTYTFRRGG